NGASLLAQAAQQIYVINRRPDLPDNLLQKAKLFFGIAGEFRVQKKNSSPPLASKKKGHNSYGFELMTAFEWFQKSVRNMFDANAIPIETGEHHCRFPSFSAEGTEPGVRGKSREISFIVGRRRIQPLKIGGRALVPTHLTHINAIAGSFLRGNQGR